MSQDDDRGRKAREARLRRAAASKGLELRRNPTRDPAAFQFGTYGLARQVDGGNGRSWQLMAGDPRTGYGLSLDDLETTVGPAGQPGLRTAVPTAADEVGLSLDDHPGPVEHFLASEAWPDALSKYLDDHPAELDEYLRTRPAVAAGYTVSEVTVPAPPPPLDPRDPEYDLRPSVHTVWDTVALFGPATRAALHQHEPINSLNYREFVRYHPQFKGNTSMPITARADAWMLNMLLDVCLEEGWLTEDGQGLISTAMPPPRYKPLSTVGGEANARAQTDGPTADQALKILTSRSARVKPSAEGRARLARSLKERGQIYPILMWHPPKLTGAPDVVVDGTARLEILTKAGVEPKVTFLPDSTTPTEVLLMRTDLEIAGTSKDLTPETREAFVVRLAASGWRHRDIAAAVDLSRSRISQIVSAGERANLAATPSSSTVARFEALRAAGWGSRDIAWRTGWSKTTVNEYLDERDGPRGQRGRSPGFSHR